VGARVIIKITNSFYLFGPPVNGIGKIADFYGVLKSGERLSTRHVLATGHVALELVKFGVGHVGELVHDHGPRQVI